MKSAILCYAVLISISTISRGQSVLAPAPNESKFGLGFQISSSPLFLFSWQSPTLNPYGRAWRIEPLIGFTYGDNEGSANNSNISESLTLGLGCSLLWRVRYPFDNLYFSFGPRVTITGYKTTSQYSYPDTQYTQKSQYLSTTLSLLAGPEYKIDDGRDAHFTIAGFLSIGATIRGRTKYDPPGNLSSWSLNIATGTGIVLRYYFK